MLKGGTPSLRIVKVKILASAASLTNGKISMLSISGAVVGIDY